MEQRKPRPRPIIVPVRFSEKEYDALHALALLDSRSRCSMIRKLIIEAARRSTVHSSDEAVLR
jgi:hypothetical protein